MVGANALTVINNMRMEGFDMGEFLLILIAATIVGALVIGWMNHNKED
jgi:putative effector of murein hydrolase LrgA (UPF0299 family)